jgi:sulfite reductase (NADPH) flavoprotein alpha-component
MANFWRRLHFLSTVVAGLFIFLASVTGCILAVEPWLLSQNAVSGPAEPGLTLVDFQARLSENFLEVFSFEKDAYGNIRVEGIGLEEEGTLFVNAASGAILQPPAGLSPLFDTSRDLHRSLFLKTPGRILMGLAALALVFLSISGIGLHIKRAGGFRSLLKSIKILELKRDGHAQWSRLFLIPILIVAVSGAYLSVVRFAPVPPNATVQSGEAMPLDQILLSDVKKVTYPVMEEEPLVVTLDDQVLYFDIAQSKPSRAEQIAWSEQLRTLNFTLHTGEGTGVWAGILLLTSLVMVFLSVTGFQMVAERLRLKKHRVVPAMDADTIILVGSETGHTWRFADALEEAFTRQGVPVSTLGMEHLPKVTGAKTLLFLTSTYGDGDAPENARGVSRQLPASLARADSIQFGVLGFGSTRYPAFCAFARELRDTLTTLNNTREIAPYSTVDNQSAVEFIEWVKALNKSLKLNLTIDTKRLHPVRRKSLDLFTIIEKTEQEDTFLLRIAHGEKLRIQSGDLLGVYPPEEDIERYYSVAVANPTEVLLVIKRTGRCSNYLGDLAVGEHFEGYIKANSTFYCPAGDKPVLFIANGTGIAPFLGMQSMERTLFWGGKYQADFTLFEKYIPQSRRYLAFSREQKKAYVQDALRCREQEVADVLREQGTIMICGSRTMLEGVLSTIGTIAATHALPSAEELTRQGRILIDCY